MNETCSLGHCIYCGYSYLYLVLRKFHYGKNKIGYQVECNHCLASGPMGDSEIDAIEKFNKKLGDKNG